MGAEQRANDILTSVPGGHGYWERLEDAIAAALRRARAEAIEECIGVICPHCKSGAKHDAWSCAARAIRALAPSAAESCYSGYCNQSQISNCPHDFCPSRSERK